MTLAHAPLGVVGVFFVLLGAGVILDADRVGWGTLAMGLGAAAMLAARRQPSTVSKSDHQ